MARPDPSERPVWSALAGRQARFSVSRGAARRFRPEFGMFAAARDGSDEALADLGGLVAAYGETAVFEASAPLPVPGTQVVLQGLGWQMAAVTDPELRPGGGFQIIPLGDADAPEMVALAELTRPGPFFARTHELGRFVGVRQEGKLVAMAGERMRPEGFTEISGVCTHPDWRGRGYAGALMSQVAAGVRARGETPMLHVFADNTGAIALYRALGFRLTRELVVSVLAPA